MQRLQQSVPWQRRTLKEHLRGLRYRYVALWARSWLGLALNLFLQMSLVSAPQTPPLPVRRHVRTQGLRGRGHADHEPTGRTAPGRFRPPRKEKNGRGCTSATSARSWTSARMMAKALTRAAWGREAPLGTLPLVRWMPGTQYTPPRLYGYTQWAVQKFTKQALLDVLPDKEEDIKREGGPRGVRHGEQQDEICVPLPVHSLCDFGATRRKRTAKSLGFGLVVEPQLGLNWSV